MARASTMPDELQDQLHDIESRLEAMDKVSEGASVLASPCRCGGVPASPVLSGSKKRQLEEDQAPEPKSRRTATHSTASTAKKPFAKPQPGARAGHPLRSSSLASKTPARSPSTSWGGARTRPSPSPSQTPSGRPLSQSEKKCELLKKHIEGLKEELAQQLRSAEDLKRRQRVLSDMELERRKDVRNSKAELEELQRTLQLEKQASAAKDEQLAAVEQTQAQLRARADNTEMLLSQARSQLSAVSEEKANLETVLVDTKSQVSEGEEERRYLHNKLQELKGNIRVYCRVRPALGSEPKEAALTLDKSTNENNAVILKTAARGGFAQKGEEYPFTFDRVFGPECSNTDLFGEISQLVRSALDGYRVCIFAYGQTGSGKTFTMEGSADDPGMIPLAVNQIFHSTEQAKERRGVETEVHATFVEIYNETLRDLLVDCRQGSDTRPTLEIKHEAEGNAPYVAGATEKAVYGPADVYTLLSTAQKNRSTAFTNCNERSSRSHSVFTLKMKVRDPASQTTATGILNLIDLAGSERLKESGATGQRLKETTKINQSLSELGNVIQRLASKGKGKQPGNSSHVPFRNSKLTHMLQHCLGGDAKTLMFLNCSPLPVHSGETLCSLRFGAKANACQIGTAKRNVS